MYNKLFDVLYSTEISEGVKVLIAENYPTQLNEGISEDSCYVEFLKTMIDTNLSEAALEEVIDETFGDWSEEQVEALTEEFIHSVVNQYLNEGIFDARPIGLTGVRKAAEKEQARREAKSQPIGLKGVERQQAAKAQLSKEPKGPSFGDKVKKTGSAALGKLKSAVGKVRDWAKKMANNDKPVGLSKLKAEQTARVNNAVNMGLVKNSEEPKAGEEEKVSSQANSEPTKSERFTKAQERAKGATIPSDNTIEMDNTGIKRKKNAEERAKGATIPSDNTIEMDNTGIKRRTNAQERAKGATLPSNSTIEMDNAGIRRRKNAEERAKGTTLPAGNKPIELKTYSFKELKDGEGDALKSNAERAKNSVPAASKTKKTTKTTGKTTKTTGKTAKKATKTASKTTKTTGKTAKKTTKTTGKTTKKTAGTEANQLSLLGANEAWDEVLNLLKASTISEETLKEITEMKSNAALAGKAVQREYDNANKSIDNLNKVVQIKVATGRSPVSSTQYKNMVADASGRVARFEKVKAGIKRKYGLEF